MSFYLAIIPEKSSADKIKRLLAYVGSLFDGYQVEVKLVKPEKFYLPLFYLGESLNPIKRFFIARKIRSLHFPLQTVGADIIKAGLSKRFKEHVALTFSEGADELRELVLKLSSSLSIQREGTFIPHLTLARVVNELSAEEYANINSALRVLNSEIDGTIKSIRWGVKTIDIIEVQDESVRVLNEITLS